MSTKFVVFVLTFIITIVTADKACDCNDEDTQALWNFLNKISQDIDGANEEDKDLYSVIPGFLSPIIDCNCLEKNRRKRHVTPEVEDASDDSITKEAKISQRSYRHKTIHFGTRHCPAGFARVGYLCVLEEFLD